MFVRAFKTYTKTTALENPISRGNSISDYSNCNVSLGIVGS